MENDDEYPEFKVVLIGDAFVGKTSLINRFYRDIFNEEESPTIAAAYLQIPVNVKGKTVKLNIWDTAGHERFHCIVPLYARTADTLIIVFDINISTTFTNAKEWLTNLSDEITKAPISFIVANKSDLSIDADTSTYEAWAKENGLFFEKTSAKTGENVSRLFMRIAEELLNNCFTPQNPPHKPGVNIQGNKEESSCC